MKKESGIRGSHPSDAAMIMVRRGKNCFLLTFERIFAIIVSANVRGDAMYNIEFYETVDGVSELWDFLDDLQRKSSTNKDARIQHKQISQYIQLLADHGTRLGENITKHLDEDIWELRPGNNRVLYFFHKENTFVLLHQFRKKTQKTPRREIEKAKSERDDWISRKG